MLILLVGGGGTHGAKRAVGAESIADAVHNYNVLL